MMSKKANVALLILLFQLIFCSTLTNVQVNGGNFGNSFKFIISGTTSEAITKSANLPVIIIISGEEKEAKCSIGNTPSGETAIYTCIYSANINGNVFLKNVQDIFEISDNLEIKPIELSIKYIETKNLEYVDGIWQYEFEGEKEGGEITLGSIGYMSIKSNDTNKIAGCSLSSKEENILLFSCKINGINQHISDKILISKNNVDNTLSFNPVLSQDMNIIIYKYISFIEAKQLTFNEDTNKWKFLIVTPYQEIPVATKSIVDILYNGALSSATCYSNDNSVLECEVDKEGEQLESDLVKVHYIKSTRSTLEWNDLTKVYEIPIAKQLKYINSYNLKYTSTKVWSFNIKIDEVVLPANALVTMDIKINDEPYVARCTHQNLILSCKTQVIEEETLSIKISYQKKDGSLSWENIRTKDLPITVSSRITYETSYDLKFANNAWNFILKANTTNEITNNNFPFSINILYGTEKNIGIAYCYPMEDNENLFDCEVDYENQNENDLIIISGSQEDVSVLWNTEFEEKKITLLSSLTYVKSFDLMYIEEKWIFKIKVQNTLPVGSKVVIDIIFDDTEKDTATCYYADRILSCTRDSITQSPSENLRLKLEKISGSINWEGEYETTEIKMPLTINKKLKKAYGLFFDDKWNFYLDVENIGIIPDDSYFILDVLHNEEEKTAICQLANRTQTNLVSILYCHLEAEEQLRTDTLELNVEKKDGSINLANSITELNNTISEASSDPTLFHILDAYDMEFVENEWIFTIIGRAERNLYKGEVFKFDVKYILLEGEFDTMAKCWTNGGSKDSNISFSCTVLKEGQSEKGLIQIKYFQSDESTLIWDGGIDDDYQITLKGMNLTMVKAYGLTLYKTWKFRIDIEGRELPPGVQIIVEVYIGTNLKSLRCTSLNSFLIICDTGSNTQTELIKLAETPSLKSSIRWIANRQPDFLIYLNFEFEFVSVYNLYFDITINVWIFVLKKRGNIPLGSKMSVDVLYNDITAVSTCYNNEDNDVLKCTVDREGQNSMDLVQLNHIKTTESSITWINLSVDEKISLICDLTFITADKLQVGSDGYWTFEIDISDETIPNYSKIVIDIYVKINNVETKSVADCYLENKKFTCITKYNSYELITIKLGKVENSLSTVTWKNKEELSEGTEDRIPMIITTSLKYINITKITYIENRYYFYVNLDNYVPQEGEVVIDIEVHNERKTSLCYAETIHKLRCEIKGSDYKNNTNIFVVQKNTDDSTVRWINYEKHIEVNVLYKTVYGAYNKQNLNSTHVGFKVLTSNDETFEDGTEITLRINYMDNNGNIIGQSIAYCTTQQEFLICTAPKNSAAADFNLYLPTTHSTSQYNYYDGIIWSHADNENSGSTGNSGSSGNGGSSVNQYTNVYGGLDLNFEVNSFDYNTESNCYEFTFQDTSYTSGKTFFVTDVTIGGRVTYAYCYYIIDYFKCKTNQIEYNESDEISISKTKTYGNVEWINVSENTKISNLYFIEISEIFGLDFVDGKWKFKIKANKSLSSQRTLVLDIYVSGSQGFANCVVDEEGLLECEVTSEQNSNSLISLNYNVNGDIKIKNLNSYNRYIPMNIELYFKLLYNMKYDTYFDKWIFYVNATMVDSSKVIPYNSVFTLDIKYGNTNGIAICYREELYSGVIILECETNQTVPSSALITLNNNKTQYSSITWRNTIPNDLDICISGDVYVSTVNNSVYDSVKQQWSFDMYLNSYYSPNFPLNSKTKIDIKYNEQKTTATCKYTYNYKLICIPDVERQSNGDHFEIIGDQEKGTLTFLNPDGNLIILVKTNLKFEMAYDLALISEKWRFKIKVSECDLAIDKFVKVDFKNDYYSYTALCTYENNNISNILSCESVDYRTYSYLYSSLYLYNNANNQYLVWNNLNKDEPIYIIMHIRVNETCGCFMENIWKFNIKYELSQGSFYTYYYSKHVLLDIMVNNEKSTALCQISYDYSNLLECESNHNNQNKNDKIIISNITSPIRGTVYITKEVPESQKEIKPIELNVNLINITSPTYNYNKLGFSIVGYLPNDFYSTTGTFTEIEVLINKTNGVEATSRASCEITYDYYYYYYFEYEYYYNQENFVLIKCVTDEEINGNDIAKIKLNSEGYSKSIKFTLTKENQELTINPKINKDNDYYDDDRDDSNKNENNNEDNNIEDEDIIDQIKDSSIIVKNNTEGEQKDEDSKTKKIIAGIIGGSVGLGLIAAGVMLWKLVKQTPNSIPNPTQQQVGNEFQNIINNENIGVYNRRNNGNDVKRSENKSIRDESVLSKQSARPIIIKKHKSKNK